MRLGVAKEKHKIKQGGKPPKGVLIIGRSPPLEPESPLPFQHCQKPFQKKLKAHNVNR